LCACRTPRWEANPPCLEYEYIAGGDLNGFMQDVADVGKGLALNQAAWVILTLADIIGHAHRFAGEDCAS